MRPGKRVDRIDRMKAVEREFRVAIVSRDHLAGALAKNPSVLTKQNLNQADFEALKENLASTYLIRLFAEFETGLREYWKRRSKKKVIPRVSDMMKSISSSRGIDHQDMENADIVRKYRNKLVHEEDSEARVVDVGEARRFLCVFFSSLPEDW
jgi:hypothetical protein